MGARAASPIASKARPVPTDAPAPGSAVPLEATSEPRPLFTACAATPGQIEPDLQASQPRKSPRKSTAGKRTGSRCIPAKSTDDAAMAAPGGSRVRSAERRYPRKAISSATGASTEATSDRPSWWRREPSKSRVTSKASTQARGTISVVRDMMPAAAKKRASPLAAPRSTCLEGGLRASSRNGPGRRLEPAATSAEGRRKTKTSVHRRPATGWNDWAVPPIPTYSTMRSRKNPSPLFPPGETGGASWGAISLWPLSTFRNMIVNELRWAPFATAR